MQPLPSPFVSDDSIPLAIGAPNGRSSYKPAIPPPMDETQLRQDLHRMREVFPGRSDFALIDLDCCILLSTQLGKSELQGFDVMVLLFLLAHFDHKCPIVHLTLTELAQQLDRNVSQVRRSMRKLEKLHWARFNRRGQIQVSPVLMRSANKKFRAIHFRHAASPFRRDR